MFERVKPWFLFEQTLTNTLNPPGMDHMCKSEWGWELYGCMVSKACGTFLRLRFTVLGIFSKTIAIHACLLWFFDTFYLLPIGLSSRWRLLCTDSSFSSFTLRPFSISDWSGLFQMIIFSLLLLLLYGNRHSQPTWIRWLYNACDLQMYQ